MTATDFRATLASLGLSQSEASRVFGVSDRAVRMWVAGDRAVPEPLAKLVKLLASGKVIVDDVRDA